jgi:GNAT superfamily N-acetyltransferase
MEEDKMKIEIQALEEEDLPEADRIFRLAFGTFIGMPDPMSFMGDADFVHTRWRASPSSALGAYVDDALAGSNFVTRWGAFAFFGPLTVRPDRWDRGVARALLAETTRMLDAWGTRQAGLFTFPDSPKHLALYQKAGFWPHHLTALMAKAVDEPPAAAAASSYGDLPPAEREACLASCGEIAGSIYAGLDVSPEILSVHRQALGDTVVAHRAGEPAAFAVCHVGAGSEAGSGTCYVKFAAARSGAEAGRALGDLLSACAAFARARGAQRLVAGVNTARHEAYRLMQERGFRTFRLGVAMQRPNDAGYNRSDACVLDDLR